LRQKSVEVIDLSNGNASCTTLPDLPWPVTGMTLTFINETLIACGGTKERVEGEITKTFTCYTLSSDSLTKWVRFSEVSLDFRFDMEASIIDEKILISGMKSLTKTLFYDGEKFSDGPVLPKFTRYHCQVTLNTTHIFFSGGTHLSKTYLLDWQTNTYTFVDSPVRSRYFYPDCAVLNNPNYGVEVFMSIQGGDTFIFSLRDLKWRPAQPIPVKTYLFAPSLVQVEGGFVVIGGREESLTMGPRVNEHIFLFDETSYRWLLQDPNPTDPRFNAAAIAVSDTFLEC